MAGLSHYQNSLSAINKFEPVYLNQFEVTVIPPSAVAGGEILLQQVTKVGGLTLDKNPGLVTQKYKFSKRNYDEQIKYNHNSNINNDWLKPQKTSVKSDKFNLNAETETNVHSNTNTNTFNLLENDEVFNKNFVTKKNVTWDDDNNIQYNIESVNESVNEYVNESVNENDVDNIFKKLKKIENPIYENNRIINLENEVKILNNKMDEIIYLLNKINK
jgi:hypothetical protein